MFSRFFIDRPIFASVLSIVILIIGGVALRSLPIAQYPEVAPPVIQVSAIYPGASAKVVGDTVATPIALSNLPHGYDHDGTRATYDVAGQGLPYDRFVLEQIERRWYVAE